MLVEHLDVVARVFLGRERVELAADRVDRLGDVFGGRVAVPLNSMCSTKWAMPLCSAGSWREPRVSQTPMLTDRTCGIGSVRRRSPLSRDVADDCWNETLVFRKASYAPPDYGGNRPQTIDRQGIRRSRHHSTRRQADLNNAATVRVLAIDRSPQVEETACRVRD